MWWAMFQLAIFFAVSFYTISDGLALGPSALLGTVAAAIATGLLSRALDFRMKLRAKKRAKDILFDGRSLDSGE